MESRDLGASQIRTFVRVTLPLSRQAILAGCIIVSLPMFGDYFTQSLLAGTKNTSMLGNLIVDSVQSSLVVQGAAAFLSAGIPAAQLDPTNCQPLLVPCVSAGGPPLCFGPNPAVNGVTVTWPPVIPLA